MQTTSAEIPPTALYALIGALWTVLQGVAVWMAHGAREASRESAKTLGAHSEKIVAIQTEISGAEGRNGMKGELRNLRDWRHDEVVPKLSRIDLLDFRVNRLEESK